VERLKVFLMRKDFLIFNKKGVPKSSELLIDKSIV